MRPTSGRLDAYFSYVEATNPPALQSSVCGGH